MNTTAFIQEHVINNPAVQAVAFAIVGYPVLKMALLISKCSK